MASEFPYDDEPFHPPPTDELAPPAPAIGDVWCRKLDAHRHDVNEGRVDVVEVHNPGGLATVWFEPRWGPNRGKPQKLSVPVFVMVYEPKVLVARRK